MPYSSEWKNNSYYMNYFGVVGSADIRQANEELTNHAEFDDLKYIVSNFLAIDELDFNQQGFSHQVEALARINAAASISNPRIRRAVVATDEAVLAFANLYIAESDAAKSPWKIKVFTSLEAAEQWLFSS